MPSVRRVRPPSIPCTLAVLAFSACASASHAPNEVAVPASDAPIVAKPAATTAATEASARDEVDRALREWFPSLRGPLTRGGVASAVLASLSERDGLEGARARMHRAIEAGDWAAARDLLSELIARGEVERAREELRRGDASSALATLDHAIGLTDEQGTLGKDADAHMLRGEAALALAPKGELDAAARAKVERALEDFLASATIRPTRAAWIGASRAASALGRREEALAHARRGLALRADASSARGTSELLPQRVLAEAATAAWSEARSGDADRARELRREASRALEAVLARTPDDAWAWNELARLRESDGDLDEAERVARAGLRVVPDDERLFASLARVVEARGGRDAVVATFDSWTKERPDDALAWWHAADARCENALAKSSAGEDASALFAAAEKLFARCRVLLPDRRRACLEREATCRAGIGWSAWRAGDLDRARAAFLSMDDLFAGGVAFGVRGQLASGVAGLDLVATAYAKRGADASRPEAIEDLDRAGRIDAFLHRADPREPKWAERAGTYQRDAAVALRERAHALAAQDPARVDEANRMIARASELMAQSAAAFQDAAELSPRDARVQYALARVLVDYLDRDPERALAALDLARASAEAELALLRARARDAKPASTAVPEIEALETLLGDVYQSLGVLVLTTRGDAKTATAWLEKSVAIGPDPRDEVTKPGGWLERARAAAAGTPLPASTDRARWNAPIARPR